MIFKTLATLLVAVFLSAFSTLNAQQDGREDGLLFYLSGDNGFEAEVAGGKATPNFLNDVEIIDDGAVGRAFRNHHFTQHFVYDAPGNIYAQRGTFSFFWRSQEFMGEVPFIIARIGPSDGSGLIMNFMRIDYNGEGGFDAFVGDINYGVTRVSHTSDTPPEANRWYHLALAWDETVGVALYLDGELIARKDTVSIYDSGLDQFGVGKRGISPIYVGNEGNFIRGGDFDEYRIYDRMLGPEQIRRLAAGEGAGSLEPVVRDLDRERWRNQWYHRYGWNRAGDLPPALPASASSIRKVQVHDAYDVKQWVWKASDGIRETHWPTVYNESRISERDKYFIQPDWNTYSVSGHSLSLFMPDEPFNHVEISGAAFGSLQWLGYDTEHQREAGQTLFNRPSGQERTSNRLEEPLSGGILRFDNDVQEMAIGKFDVYRVEAGRKPAGRRELSYRVDPSAAADNVTLEELNRWIDGRFLPDERSRVVALPQGAPRREAVRSGDEKLPLVHILVPFEFRHEKYDMQGFSGIPTTIPRFSYTWENMHAGLDGIEVVLPALDLEPTHDGMIALNLRVMDPIWPDRTMLDFTFSVEPGREQTLWLDTRDRILPNGYPLYLRIASSSGGFGAESLDGTGINLVFKEYEKAKAEHVEDRFTQIKANAAHFSEPGANSKLLKTYKRFSLDMEDLFRVDPHHWPGREYWFWNNRYQGQPAYEQTSPPSGVPLWAHRQVELLGQVRHFSHWWIDERQIGNGEFGGGLSDDGDMTPQLVAAAMMGVTPEKITDSILRLMNAYFDQGLFTDGLATIMTDELHAYEEGIQVLGQDLQLRYGNPTAVTRLMETAAAYDRITDYNDRGYRQFISSYYSGSQIAEETVWQWQYPYSFLILDPGIRLVDFNGSPQVKELLLELADGLLSNRVRDERGNWSVNTMVHFPSGEPHPEYNPGLRHAAHLLWAAWRWTGEERYLQPILDQGPSSMGILSAGLLDQIEMRDEWKDAVLRNTTPHSGSGLFRHLAWQLTGNDQYLEQLYSDQVAANASLMYVNTEGHLWTDRVSVPSQDLQRARLGGVGSWRSAIYPAHLVSWEFEQPARAEDVAIKFPVAGRDRAEFHAFNLKRNEEVRARMHVWDLDPGLWEVTEQIERDGEWVDVAVRQEELERTRVIEFTFAPVTTTRVVLRQVEDRGTFRNRADLAIGEEEVRRQGNRIHVTVHNIGAAASPQTEIAFLDESGREIDRRRVRALEAPVDLSPRTDRVTLRVPAGTSGRIVVDPDNRIREITRINNELIVP